MPCSIITEDSNLTDTEAAYTINDIPAVNLKQYIGQKRERSPSLQISSNDGAYVNNDRYADVVEHSNRLLEILRVRKKQLNNQTNISNGEYNEVNDTVITMNTKKTHSTQYLASSMIQLPVCDKNISKEIDINKNCDVRISKKDNEISVSNNFKIYTFSKETQTVPSEISDEIMSIPDLTNADLLVLRLCELDALLHIFFS